MEKLRVEVMIMKDHKLGDNDYVRGRINGIIDCICETYNDRHYANRETTVGTIMTNHATIEEYVKLKSRLTRSYPDLCKIGCRVIED